MRQFPRRPVDNQYRASDSPHAVDGDSGNHLSCLFFFFCLDLRGRIQRHGRMSVSAARAHPDGFHDLLRRPPSRIAARVWPRMQYGHCVTWANATAINCFVFAGIAPSTKTLLLKAWKAAAGPGARWFRCSTICRVACGYICSSSDIDASIYACRLLEAGARVRRLR